MSLLDKLLEEVKIERQRQIDLPGSEYDLVNGVNDWIAIASHYLTQDCTRKGINPTRQDFHSSLIKSAAVIIAALEYEENLVRKGQIKE